MPKKDYKMFLKAIGLDDSLPGLSYIPCKLKFVLDFYINGAKFSLTAQELMVRYSDGCVLEVDVTSSKNDQSWVLGVPFGRTYCNIHGECFNSSFYPLNLDMKEKRIGFARAKTNLSRNRTLNCGISCKSKSRNQKLKQISNITRDSPDDLLPWPIYKLDDIK
jgi:hypothetical protein